MLIHLFGLHLFFDMLLIDQNTGNRSAFLDLRTNHTKKVARFLEYKLSQLNIGTPISACFICSFSFKDLPCI